MSSTVRRLIKEAIEECKTTDMEVLLPLVCEKIEKSYSVGRLDYFTKKMGVATTSEIKNKINEYVQSHKVGLYKKGYYKIEAM